MANEGADWDDDDSSNNNAEGNNAPKGLRAHAKAVDDENKQLKAKLVEFENAARKSRVEKALTTKGFDPKVADLVPPEVASDESALDKWLTEKEGLFVKANAESEPTVPQGYDDGVLTEDDEGMMRVSQVMSSALPASKSADIRSAIAAAKTKDEMNEILRKYGNSFVA